MLAPWILLLLAAAPALCYKVGAPTGACKTMMPVHGTYKPQNDTAPYKITTCSTSVRPGGTIMVNLQGVGAADFKGYMLMAVNKANGKVVGFFKKVPEGSKKIDCGVGKLNAVTHSNSATKTAMRTFWQAGTNLAPGTKFVIRATVVKEFKTFWTNVESGTIVITKA